MRTAIWTSPIYGETLTFEIHDTATKWREVAGIYMFCRRLNSSWEVIYVGQTTDFKQRFASHEHWTSAIDMGCSAIHAVAIDSQPARDRMEEMLIKHFDPPLNSQLRSPRTIDIRLANATFRF